MNFLFWIALASLVLIILAAIELFIGNRSVKALRDVSPETVLNPQRVSIIVAARNEQRNIRAAITSLLSLSYPNYELIVVNDRSEDDTGKILAELSTGTSHLKIIHIEVLPPGWLGKNHALWAGSHVSTGELFLFTDADIIMESTVLSRAVNFINMNRLDHLAATPSMKMPNTFLGMFGAAFIVIFSLFARPWKARDTKSRFHIGIGAFNLVSAHAYRKVGGHETIRLRPDDDIKLGKIIKSAGFRQDAAYAPEFLAVEWYSSIGEVIKGLEKNAFSGADYNIPLVLAGVIFHILCSVWPFVAVFILSGWTQIIYITTALLIMLTVADCARFHHSRSWYAVGYPLSAALFVYILLRTMLLNILQGGIRWRGTFYPLKELKANRI